MFFARRGAVFFVMQNFDGKRHSGKRFFEKGWLAQEKKGARHKSTTTKSDIKATSPKTLHARIRLRSTKNYYSQKQFPRVFQVTAAIITKTHQIFAIIEKTP